MNKSSGFLYKIMAVVIASITTFAIFVAVYTVLRVHNSLRQALYTQLNKSYNGTAHLFDIYKRNALGFSKDIAVNPDLVRAAKAKDHEALFAITTPLVEDAGLEYMVITDAEGFVIIRTHQPGVIPAPDDSIAGQTNVQHALRGEAFATVEQGKVVFLSVRAGAPIRDEDGTIIGVCSTGYVLSENTIANDIKKTFDVECTLYLHDRVVASTFDLPAESTFQEYVDNGEAIVARVMDGEIIDTMTYVGEKSYLTTVGPLVGAGDEVVGMIEVAMDERILGDEINAMVRNIVLGTAFIALLMLGLTLLVFQRVLRPVAGLVQRLKEVAEGNLSGAPLEILSNDEIGALSRSGNEMQQKLRALVGNVVAAAERVATASEELDASAQQIEQRSWDITAQIRDVTEDVEKIAVGESFDDVRTSLKDTKDAFLDMSETMTGISRAANELSVLAEELSDSTATFKL